MKSDAHTADADLAAPDIRTKSKFRENIESILWAVLIVLIIRGGIVQTFKIPSGSMENTLLVGDFLLVNKFLYGIPIPFTHYRLPKLRSPERGDVIVFKFPKDRSKDYIKRVVGVPGDTIEIRNKTVYVNGTPYLNPQEIHRDTRVLPMKLDHRDNYGPVTVPPDSYFVMGDNRDNSFDSRYWGFVKNTDLVGKARIKYWSWDSGNRKVRWNRLGRIID